MNRRTLLKLVGRAGGTAATLTLIKAMGLLDSETTGTERPELPAESGKGIKVAIIGAGIAGMSAAYELSKAGYECQILEARDRAGGRCWTIRGGDTVQEIGSQQTCPFARGNNLHFNPGPARIPHHHQGILGYCREFGIPLQVLVNENRACYFHDNKAFAGQPLRNRRVIHDTRGQIAELLAKAINQKALEAEVSISDQEKILELLQSFGDLDSNFLYTGSSRAGYQRAPGAGLNSGEIDQPLNLSELLKSDFWEYKMDFAEGYSQAATMLEPVGGMDQIAQAFAQRVAPLIINQAKVTAIRKTENGVRLIYQHSGEETVLDADFAICTLPLSVLNTLEADFSPPYQSAIAQGAQSYIRAVKHGFQANRRFWEEDEQIYGGISWTTNDITQIWYPSAGFGEETGILVGAYIWQNEIADPVAAMSPRQRLEIALKEGEALHSNYTQELSLDRGVSVAWGEIPYSLGGWMSWEETARETAYRVLNAPDDRIYLAGEHMSYLTGWQEGAVLSAHQVVGEIAQRVQAQSA